MAVRHLFVSLATMLVVVPATAAVAQVEMPTGSRVGRPAPAQPASSRAITDEDRALRITQDYARCLVQREQRAIRAMLADWPNEMDQSEQRLLLQPRCLGGGGGTLGMPPVVLRGALFRVFYQRDFGNVEITQFGEPLDYFEHVDHSDAAAVTTATLLDFASCVVRADSANAVRFVAAIPGEPKFEAALEALIPQLGPCLTEGLEIQMNETNLATYLSEAVYREATAARGQALLAAGSE